MPDWITHISIALIIVSLFDLKKGSLLVVGSLLPDFITKVYLANTFFRLPEWFTWNVHVFHTLYVGVLLSVLAALLFYNEELGAFILIPFGVVLHLLADYLIRPDLYWLAMVISLPICILFLYTKRKVAKNETQINIGR